MRKDVISTQGGFTLIETMIAMAIFTIGILGVLGMQLASINENLTANSITNGANWAADQIEQILATDYTALLEWDEGTGQNNNGCNGLSDWQGSSSADQNIVMNGNIPVYRVYVNVARDCLLTDIPNKNNSEEQKPLALRIIVTVEDGNGKEDVRATFDYIKQNSAKKT